MKTGIVIQNNELEPWPIETNLKLANLADDLGFDSFWTNYSLPAKDPFLILLRAGQVTSRVSLGTSVVNPYANHPAALASSAATLQALLQRPVILGLGSSFPVELSPFGIKQEHPVEVMREATMITKLVLTGKKVSFTGKYFNLVDGGLNFTPKFRIPVLVGAQGERMLRMSGEVADGIMIPAGNFKFYDFAVETFTAGLGAAKRSREETEVIANVNFILTEDADEAIREAKPEVADSVAYRSPAALAVMGLSPKEAQEIGKNPQLLSDSFVEEAVIFGNPSECVEKLSKLKKRGIDHVILRFPNQERVRQFGKVISLLKEDHNHS